MKEPIKNLRVTVQGFTQIHDIISRENLDCIITNDYFGKKLSIGKDDIHFTIAFEQIERYLK